VLPDLGLLTLRDAESGEVKVVPGGTRASQLPQERLDEVRRAGARASLLSTDEDAFHRLQVHFRMAR